MAIKRIPITSAAIGMYLCGIDRSWLNTPFFLHRFLIKTQDDIEKLKNCGIHEITIDTDRGIDLPSVEQLPEPLLPNSDTNLSFVPPILAEEQRIHHLPNELQGTSLAHELTATKQNRAHMLEEIRDVLGNFGKTGRIPLDQINQVTRSIMQETLNHEDAYLALVQTREFSPLLYDHALTVSTLAVFLGRAAGLDDQDLHHLGTAGLLHDVGLLSLPKQLHRPLNQLSESELTIYKSHPMRGVSLLSRKQQLPSPIIDIIQEHHVNPDGSGYPPERSHFTISIPSRILRIVDEYDEFLSGHQTGEPLPVRTALQSLYQQGQRRQLDAELVAKFIHLIGIYPTYSVVELTTGERGIVTGNSHHNLLQPTILLIQNADHQPLSEPIPLNFSVLPPDLPKPEIVGVLSPEEVGIKVDSALEDWVTL